MTIIGVGNLSKVLLEPCPNINKHEISPMGPFTMAITSVRITKNENKQTKSTTIVETLFSHQTSP
jgi:hypothetical protein